MRAIAAAVVCTTAAALVISVPPTCSPNCSAPLNAAIQQCPPAGPCTVQLDAGTYILDGPAYSRRITISGLSNFALLGAGPSQTQIVVDDIANDFGIWGGSNLTIGGFSIDMIRLPYTYGSVVAVTPTNASVAFDSSVYPIDLQRYPWLTGVQGVLSYDPVKQRVAPAGGTDIYALPPNELNCSYPSTTTGAATGAHTGTAAASGLMVIQLPPGMHSSFRLNDTVVVRHQTYSFDAFDVSDTSGFTLSHVTLWAAGGMGLLCNNVHGPITVDAFRIEKKVDPATGVPRPMSIDADGMHFSNTQGGDVAVVNSLFEGQGDDGFNIPTIFMEAVWVSADRTQLRAEGRGSNGPSPPPGGAAVGSVLKFWARQTMEMLGTGVITSIGPNNTITMGAPLPPGVGAYSLLTAAAAEAGSVLLRNNTFRANRARGALLKSSNVHAENNTFEGISGPAIKTETDGCYWFEGHPVTNWTLVGNVFTENNFAVAQMQGDVIIDSSVPVFVNGAPTTKCLQPTQPSPAVQHGVNISGNVFTQISGQAAIALFSTQGAAIVGNTITREAGAVRPQFDVLGAGVTDAMVTGNVCDGGACVTQGV